MNPKIRDFQAHDQSQVVELWQRCELTRPWNDPILDIQRKARHGSPFWVIPGPDRIWASIMVGYDGHRGSVNYLAVDPDKQGQGLGRLLMQHACDYLLQQGCPKLNLMVRADNPAAEFYSALAYDIDAVQVMSIRLIHD